MVVYLWPRGFYIPRCFGAFRASPPLLRCLCATAFLKGPGHIMISAFLLLLFIFVFYFCVFVWFCSLFRVDGPGGFLNALPGTVACLERYGESVMCIVAEARSA